MNAMAFVATRIQISRGLALGRRGAFCSRRLLARLLVDPEPDATESAAPLHSRSEARWTVLQRHPPPRETDVTFNIRTKYQNRPVTLPLSYVPKRR